jgi:hypothetical protein
MAGTHADHITTHLVGGPEAMPFPSDAFAHTLIATVITALADLITKPHGYVDSTQHLVTDCLTFYMVDVSEGSVRSTANGWRFGGQPNLASAPTPRKAILTAALCVACEVVNITNIPRQRAASSKTRRHPEATKVSNSSLWQRITATS